MIVLTDKKLNAEEFKVQTVLISGVNGLKKYAGNEKVAVICGSRAMCRFANKLSFPSLKLFQLTSAGFDGVPLEDFAKKGVAVANAGGVYNVPIAETVVFGMLQFAKRYRINPNKRNFKLTRGYNLITELKDKKVLIMGAGNIGTAIADRLLSFEMFVDGYDPYCKEKSQYGKIMRSREELKSCINDYDYIVSTLPHTEETKGFINEELFSLMKNTVVIVNVGRRDTFNEDDFYRALKNGVLGGAVLDMFEVLPNPITNKFRRLNNVIVWPGVSACSKELDIRLREHMTSNVVAALENGKIKNVINGV